VLVVGNLVPVLGLGVIVAAIVADFKYQTSKEIGLPLSRARVFVAKVLSLNGILRGTPASNGFWPSFRK